MNTWRCTRSKPNASYLHNFEWDPSKARQNLRKHRVSFERAAIVFLDANQVSALDEEHDADEERYITLGIDSTGIIFSRGSYLSANESF